MKIRLLSEKDISVWKKKAAWVAANHGMILTLTHPDYLMEGDHLRLYEELLAYLKEIPNAWHCLPREMARWYTQLPDRREGKLKSHPVNEETARTVGQHAPPHSALLSSARRAALQAAVDAAHKREHSASVRT